jgi:hypothetical protein
VLAQRSHTSLACLVRGGCRGLLRPGGVTWASMYEFVSYARGGSVRDRPEQACNGRPPLLACICALVFFLA